MKRVLVVCLGNICRSPLACAALRARIAARGLGGRLEVDSCGTSGWHDGEGAHAETARYAAARGIDLSAHVSRRLRAEDFDAFDAIVVMDRSNERDVRARRPAGATAAVRRWMDFVPGADGPDVPDPWGGPGAGFERVHDLAEQGADGVIDWVLGAG